VEKGDHDLVVIGSRGRGRVASGVFGSVVGDVHFAVSVPMLVVHPAARS
jgi:nucleotide-binding universal stress UspA family protein